MKEKKNDAYKYNNKNIKRRIYKGKWYYNIDDILKAINETKNNYFEEIINDFKKSQKIINIYTEEYGTKESIFEILKKTTNKETEKFKIWFTSVDNKKIYIKKTPLEKYHKKIESLKKGLKRKNKRSNNYKKEKIKKTYKKINNYRKHNKRNRRK